MTLGWYIVISKIGSYLSVMFHSTASSIHSIVIFTLGWQNSSVLGWK